MKIHVVLEDLCGRQIRGLASFDASRVIVGLVPFGALVFHRTGERDLAGRLIFRQVDTPNVEKAVHGVKQDTFTES